MCWHSDTLFSSSMALSEFHCSLITAVYTVCETGDILLISYTFCFIYMTFVHFAAHSHQSCLIMTAHVISDVDTVICGKEDASDWGGSVVMKLVCRGPLLAPSFRCLWVQKGATRGLCSTGLAPFEDLNSFHRQGDAELQPATNRQHQLACRAHNLTSK